MYEIIMRDIEVLKNQIEMHGCSLTYLMKYAEEIEHKVQFFQRYQVITNEEADELFNFLKSVVSSVIERIE